MTKAETFGRMYGILSNAIYEVLDLIDEDREFDLRAILTDAQEQAEDVFLKSDLEDLARDLRGYLDKNSRL